MSGPDVGRAGPLDGLVTAVLGGPQPVTAARLTGLAAQWPRSVRVALYATGAALDGLARARTGRPLAALDETALARVRRAPGVAAVLDVLKPALLLCAAQAPTRTPDLARPDPDLDCTPAAHWPDNYAADAVVIGSGAGGAIAARELARAGLRVVVVEEGRRYTSADVRGHPAVDRYARFYRDGGATFALGVPPILLPEGRAVGGTTFVNSGTCFRTPTPVLRRWRDTHGVPVADPDRFAPLLDEVERTLRVAPSADDVLGSNAGLALAGAAALGWTAAPVRRNAPGCAGSCQCVVGCPRNAKYGVHLSVLPDACAAGARIVTQARAERILVRRGRACGVRAVRGDGTPIEILAPLVVVAAGAVQTPALLRRSGLGAHPGLGRGLAVHPAISIAGRFADPVLSSRGVLQSVGVEELHDEGILIEATAAPPGMTSYVPPGLGPALATALSHADHTAALGAMVADAPGGRVHGARQPVVTYRLARRDAGRLRRAVVAMGRILFAAGAAEVLTGLPGRPVAGTVAELADAVDTAPTSRLRLAAFHPTGSARMGADPQRHPVDPDGALRGVDGVLVADASVLPSCPTVNPQLSIMAMALAVARSAAR